MADVKINMLPTKSSVDGNEYALVIGTNEEYRIKYSDMPPTFYKNSGSHNGIYRGKSLGSTVTEAQWSAISAGTFAAMWHSKSIML